MVTRRSFAALAAGLLAGCTRPIRSDAATGPRLQSRPTIVAAPCEPGQHPLKLREQRDTLFYVPKSAPADKPAPLVLFLHGATGSEQQGIRRLGPLADELGFLLLSPASADQTWDGIRDGYGPDVQTIDRALARAFSMRRVDPARIAVAGFSDGASYAVGLGVSNGELFNAVLAFSPCFIPPGAARHGKPRIFVSHGDNDTILPRAQCSGRLVPELKRAGYQVNYREFEGPHTVPPDVAKEALRWFIF